MKHSSTDFLFYHAPAADWNGALPLGNGKLGAMVYGRTDEERIDLNYDELWSGYPREDTHAFIGDLLKEAASLAEKGNLEEAEALVTGKIGESDAEAYLPFGSLHISVNHRDVSDYERSLDLTDGVQRVSYRTAQGFYRRELFISFPDRVFVMRVAAEGAPFCLEATFSSPMRYSLSKQEGLLVFDGECIANSAANHTHIPKERDFLYSDQPQERGILYRGALGVKTDGRVKVKEKALILENATEAVFFFCAESSFAGYDRHPFLDGKEYKNIPIRRVKELLCEEYDSVLKRHTEDYRSLYEKCALTLGEGETDIPSDERLKACTEGEELDVSLVTLLFNYAKYLTVAASREGSEAMNLQGIWNPFPDPMWYSDYTTNINTQMNYFPTLALGLTSCYQPLLKLVEGIAHAGKKTAEDMYGARGFVAHHNIDLWRKTTPATGKLRWSFFSGASGWLVSAAYEYVRYTDDRKYLKETLFPILKDACLFYLDILAETPEGKLVITPATSPENTYLHNGQPLMLSYTTAMANDIVAVLFDDLLDAARRLKMTDGIVDAVRIARPKILPPRIGSDGTLMEWYDERALEDEHHRHISHLYALYPAHLISPYKDPDLAAACRTSLDKRGDEGTGWSLSWKMACRARLGDGEHAARLLKMQLRLAPSSFSCSVLGGGVFANFLDAHPPFQIDGNFGVAAGIIEMLLSYDEENIYLLPALPKAWAKGSFRDFVTPFGAVSCSWENGRLSSYSVTERKMGVNIIYRGEKL